MSGTIGDNVYRASGVVAAASAGGGTSWQSVETGASFTAVAGNGYPVNTTAQACTVTLPAGSVGDTIEFVDYAGTWDTNKVTLTADGSEKIKGSTDDGLLNNDRQGIKIVYVDATQGWVASTGINVNTAPSIKAPPYNIEYLVVAGAGGGGEGNYAGGGGAGGYLTNTAAYDQGNVLTIVVGAGGAGSSSQSVDGTNGGASSITSSGTEATVTCVGGGGGASRESNPGADGGSGGGAARTSGSGGSATAGQGNDGGSNTTGYGGGGGGAGAAGPAGGDSTFGAVGGDGLQNDIVEATVDVYYAGGGAGGGTSRSGGQGGGGSVAGGVGGAGTDGLGGGGAGGYGAGDNGGDGGDGIVILRMLTADYSGNVSGNETPTVDGDYTVINFENTAGGSYTA